MIVKSNALITYLKLDGSYIDSFTTNNISGCIIFLNLDRYIIEESIIKDNCIVHKISIINRKNNNQKSVYEFEDFDYIKKHKSKISDLSSMKVARLDSNSKGEIVYAFTNEYRVFLYDGVSTITLISRDIEPAKISKKWLYWKYGDELKDNSGRKYILPKYYSVIRNVMFDEKDNLWIYVCVKEGAFLHRYLPNGKFLNSYQLDIDINDFSPRRIEYHFGYFYILVYADDMTLEVYRAKAPD